MSELRKISKYAGVVAAAAIVLASASTLIVFFFPQIIGHLPLTQRMANSLLPQGVRANWDDLRLNLSSDTFFEKSLTLDLRNFCLIQRKGELELCFKEIHVPLKVRFYSTQVDSYSMEEARLTGGRLFYKMGNDVGKEGEKGKGPTLGEMVEGARSILAKGLIKSLKVSFEKVELESQGKLYGGKLDLSVKMPRERLEARLSLENGFGPPLEGRKNALLIDLHSSFPQKSGRFPLEISLKAQATMMDGKALALSLKSSPLKGEALPLGLEWQGSLLSKRQKVEGRGRMTIARDALEGNLQLQVQMAAPPGRKRRSSSTFTFRQCNYSYHFGELRHLLTSSGKIKLDCEMKAKDLSSLLSESAEGPKVELPTLDFRLALDLTAKGEGDLKKKLLAGQLNVQLLALEKIDLLKGRGAIQVSFRGPADKLVQGEGIKGKVNLGLRLKDVQILQRLLKDNNILVPAPLHVLRGPLDIDLHGRAPAGNGTGLFSMPFVIKSDLHSSSQVFRAVLQGDFNMSEREKQFMPSMEATLTLSEVRLILPQFIPRHRFNPFPDSRIFKSRNTVAAKAKARAFNLNLKILTAKQGALQLISPISKEAIPLSLALAIKDNRFTGGKIAVHTFDMNLLKKNAQLVFLDLDLGPDVTNIPINGKVLVSYADYAITVNLAGTVDEPKIFLESRPPLPEDDLMAVLLFGRPLKELSGEEGDSVSSMKAAAANGAVSFASLYLLSSTPIESVGYNPETNQMTAKIKLGSKTSLTLGSGTEEESKTLQSIGVRRKLGPNFSVRTEVQTDKENSKSKVWTFLEWYNRY